MTNKSRSLAILALVVLGLGLAVGACGRKGDPVLPEGAADTFPDQYPRSSTKQTGLFTGS